MGKISDKQEMKKVYRENHIFALPSKSETFGLVYIEAISQVLPIIYLKNESVDGMFMSKVGEKSIDPKVHSLMKSLVGISDDYKNIDLFKVNFSHFSWSYISSKYYEIYKQYLV